MHGSSRLAWLFRFRSAPVLLVLVLLSLALNYVYLRSGFQADDLIFLNMRQTEPLPFSRWSGVWSAPIESYEGFRAMWWLEPGARGAFFRPIPSLVIEGSLELFGTTALPLHLASVVLHGAVAFTVFLLFRRLTGGRALPLLSAIVFLACEDHSMGVGWIATITDILCVLLANAALLLHLAFRASGRPAPRVASLVCLALAFGCKESAALAPVAIVGLELVLPESLPAAPGAQVPVRWRADLQRWLGRWRRWLPAALLMTLYLALYKLGGFGISTLMYLDPVSAPLPYLKNLLMGLPIMVLAAVTPVMPSFVLFMPESAPWLAAAGALTALLLGWGLRPLMREPVVRYSTAMFFVALLPQLATLPSERLLYFPLVFGSYALARLIAEMRPAAKRLWPDRTATTPWITRLWAWSLAGSAVVVGLILSASYPHMYAASLDQPKRELAAAAELVRQRRPERVVVLNTSGMFLTLYAGDVLQYLSGHKVPVHLLSSAHARFTIERLSERSFVLRADRKGWISNMFAGLVRTKRTVRAGAVYQQPRFTATVLEVTADSLDALAVRFDFEVSLDSAPWLLLTWTGDRFVPLDYGALPPGQPRLLADTSDLWKVMMGD